MGQLHSRNQVERRRQYFEELKHQLPGGEEHPLIPLLKKCLSNDPLARPNAQELVDSLRRMSNGNSFLHVFMNYTICMTDFMCMPIIIVMGYIA